jgi:hypothetical protein
MAQEQLSVEIIAEYLGRQVFPEAIADVQKVQRATEGLTQSQRALRRQQEEAAKAIRTQRVATAQLGMQFSQISTQMAAGTPIATIFAQQIGDVGYAMSNMGGAMGRVGRFMSGPLGVGLAITGMAFLALKGNADKAKESTVGFAEYAKATMITLGDAVEPVAKKMFEPFEPAVQFAKDHMADFVTFTENALNVVIQSGMALATAIVQTIGRSPALIKGFIYAAINGIIVMINFVRDKFADFINSIYGGVRKAAAFVGVNLPEFSLKFTPFSTKESGLSENFAKIDDAIKTAVTTKYIDFSKIGKMASSLVEPKDTKDKKGSAKEDVDPFIKNLEDNLEGAMKGLDAYSKAYGETISGNIKAAADAFEEQQKRQDQMKDYFFNKDQERAQKMVDAYEAVGQSISNGFKDMITGAAGFGSMMKNIIGEVINQLWQMYVVQQIVGMVKKVAFSVFGVPTGMKAIGGPVQAGSPYIVGERGPEMFVPSRSGSIVPNNKMGGGMVINVDARGSSDPAAVRQQVELGIAQAAPYIIAAAQNRTLKTAGRTRLPGTIG